MNPEKEKEGEEAGRAEKPQTRHLLSHIARPLLFDGKLPSSTMNAEASSSALIAVRITYLSRGVPNPCARIYRLPPPQAIAEHTRKEDPNGTAMTSTGPTASSNSTSETAAATAASIGVREQWLALAPKTGTGNQHKPNRARSSRLPMLSLIHI